MTFVSDFIHFVPKSVRLHEILLIFQCEMTKTHIPHAVLIQDFYMISSICQMKLAEDLAAGKTKELRICEELQYRGRRFS